MFHIIGSLVIYFGLSNWLARMDQVTSLSDETRYHSCQQPCVNGAISVDQAFVSWGLGLCFSMHMCWCFKRLQFHIDLEVTQKNPGLLLDVSREYGRKELSIWSILLKSTFISEASDGYRARIMASGRVACQWWLGVLGDEAGSIVACAHHMIVHQCGSGFVNLRDVPTYM